MERSHFLRLGLAALPAAFLAACGSADSEIMTELWKGGDTASPAEVVTAAPLTNGVPRKNLNGSPRSATYFELSVPQGASQLVFELQQGEGNSDPDLYVKQGGTASRTNFDCRSWSTGAVDRCVFDSPAPGTYSVMVYGYEAYSQASLVGQFQGGGGGGTNPGRGAAVSVHTRLGLPADATDSTQSPEAYLSVKSEYVLSYNSARKTPNWVSWELNGSYFGSAGRSDRYRADNTLPATLPQAANSDYSGSGYDRGHLCPSRERTATVAQNENTFYLTNMVPQAPNNNRGPWQDLEAYESNLASQGKQLFVVAGGIYDSAPATIGKGVAVPVSTFKVVVVLDSANQGADDVTSATRVIAVVVPNDDARVAQSADWETFRTSVRDIERQTGLDLLSDVAPAVQDAVETRVDAL